MASLFLGMLLAFNWHTRSEGTEKLKSAGNNALAQILMALMATDKVTSMQWYELAAAQKNPVAEFSLVCCYYHGHRVAVDRQKSTELVNRAIDHGYVNVQEELLAFVVMHNDSNIGQCWL